MGVDDPLDSSAIHCGSGILGVLVSGFLARPSYVMQMVGCNCGGVVYATNGGMQLGMQLLGEWHAGHTASHRPQLAWLVQARRSLIRLDGRCIWGMDARKGGGTEERVKEAAFGTASISTVSGLRLSHVNLPHLPCPAARLCAGLSCSMVWTAMWALLTFGILKKLQLLRVDQQTELAGIDNMEHGGPAYPEFLQRVQSTRPGY